MNKMKNTYLPKKKDNNKVNQIKEAIWEVLDGLGSVSRETKYER